MNLNPIKKGLTILVIAFLITSNLLWSDDTDWYQKGLDSKDNKEKIEFFNKDLEVNGPSKFTYFNLGNAKASMMDFQGAVESYDKAIEMDTLFYDAIFNRGLSKKNLGDFQSAIDDFSKVIVFAPGDYYS